MIQLVIQKKNYLVKNTGVNVTIKIYVRSKLTYYVYYSIIGNSHNNFCMNVTTFKTKKGFYDKTAMWKTFNSIGMVGNRNDNPFGLFEGTGV